MIVAFSGGADSVCLLKRLIEAGLAARLSAIHVDHRLDPDSPARAARAGRIAARFGVSFETLVLDPAAFDLASGPEAAARHARYAALAGRLGDDDTVLTAHHLDDQVETLLLKLLRGAGPAGLAGMPVRRPLGRGWLGRPLLAWPREALQQELHDAGQDWIEDPTNASTDPDRNYLRHEVLPRLEQRWGRGYRGAIERARVAQGNAADAVEVRARADLVSLRCDSPCGRESTLDLAAWLRLESARAFEALRRWLAPDAPPPPDRFDEFRRQCRDAAADRCPAVTVDAVQLRAWRDRLWRDRCPDPVPANWSIELVPGTTELALPHGLGRLSGLPVGGQGNEAVTAGAFRAGDRMRLRPDGPTQRVAELLRMAGVPPWRRHRLPVLRVAGRVAAVGGRWHDPSRLAAAPDWHAAPAGLVPYASPAQ
nr:tRNA lysidine(34) synthetase TilS [Wenzhouxiangella sp. XN79A]